MRDQATIVDPIQVAKVRMARIMGVHPDDISDRRVEQMAELVRVTTPEDEEVVGWIE